MLLRAGLVYVLATFCFVLSAAVFLSRLELGATRETAVSLSDRVLELQRDLEAERAKLAAAERRALVAEDSLERAASRQEQAQSEAAGIRLKLADELTSALRERDLAQAQAARLEQDLQSAQASLRAAQAAAEAARDGERTARSEVQRLTDEAARAATAAAAQKNGSPASRTGKDAMAGRPTGSIEKEPSAAGKTQAKADTPAESGGTVETYPIIPPEPAKAASDAAQRSTAEKAAKSEKGGKGANRKGDDKKASAKKPAERSRKPAAKKQVEQTGSLPN